MTTFARLLTVVFAAVVGACDTTPSTVLMASTTSTDDSELLDVLVPAFEAAHPEYELRYTAVGSGQALALGRRGDVDVLLVHSPSAEAEFMAAGHGLARCTVMFNDYVLLGPPSDPAGVAEPDAPGGGGNSGDRGGERDILGALGRIADAGAAFASRGDDSGTHHRERRLWREADESPTAPWYLEVGQGMGQTLQFASEKQTYTLSDRSTYLAMRNVLDLEVAAEGDPLLLNHYSVIPVASASNPGGAAAFSSWITGPEAQELIGDFRADPQGQRLFTPNGSGCDY